MLRTEDNGGTTIRVELACPKCGGENVWALLQTFTRCSYCDSTLWRPPDPTGRWYLEADNRIDSDEDALELILMHDAIRYRADLVPQGNDQQTDGIFITEMYHEFLPDLQKIMDRRRHRFSIRARKTFYVPYTLWSSHLAFHSIGREAGTRKVYRTLFFLVEELLPDYIRSLNLRDRGLWMSRRPLRAIQAEDVARGDFLRPAGTEAEEEKLKRTWIRNRNLLKSDFQPLFFLSSFLEPCRWEVFRPYIYILADTPKGTRWILLDGQFGTVAGYPAEYEVQAMEGAPRLSTSDLRISEPHILSSRCPVCGHTLGSESRGYIQPCDNCGRALKPGPDGFSPVGYSIFSRQQIETFGRVPMGDTTWIPFWGLAIRWHFDGKVYETTAALQRELFGQPSGRRALELPEGHTLYLPAFDVRVFDGYDRWILAAAGSLTGLEPEHPEARLFLDEPVVPGRALAPDLPSDAWDPLLPLLHFDLLPSTVRGRLTPVILRRASGVQAEVLSRGLFFAPFPLTDVGANPGRLLGPGGHVDWTPMETRRWPPGICRTARRWKERADE